MRTVTDRGGEPLRVTVRVNDEDVAVQVWRVDVRRVPLYLLDTDLPSNSMVARWITSRLYEGNRAIRLAQYAVLGVGGARALAAMDIRPTVYHLNEGHPALAALEVLTEASADGAGWDDPWSEAAERVVFTTHTPVPAGNETYTADEMLRMLSRLLERTGNPDRLLAAGRVDPKDPSQPSGMTAFALRASRAANAVSRRHGEVARAMWQALFPDRAVDDVPITHVNNGVLVPAWLCTPMRRLLDRHLGDEWLSHADNPRIWEAVDAIPDDELQRPFAAEQS